uniref:Uncharacterized protein n=1 Tax=Oryza barthii TaxID=65489 RepID=A0A0D3FL88_9ORYZ
MSASRPTRMRFECPKMATGSWRKRGRMKLGDDAASVLWSEWHHPPSHASRLARRRHPQPSSSFSSLPSEFAGHTAPDPLNPKLAGHSVARFTPVEGEPEERGRHRGNRGRRLRRPCRAGRGGGGEALEPSLSNGCRCGCTAAGGRWAEEACDNVGCRRLLPVALSNQIRYGSPSLSSLHGYTLSLHHQATTMMEESGTLDGDGSSIRCDVA